MDYSYLKRDSTEFEGLGQLYPNKSYKIRP